MPQLKPFVISKVFNLKEIFFFFLVCVVISIFIYFDNLSHKEVKNSFKNPIISKEKSVFEKKEIPFYQKEALSQKKTMEQKIDALLKEKKFNQAKTFIRQLVPQALKNKELKQLIIEKAMVAGGERFSIDLAIEIANKTRDKEDIKRAIEMCLWAQKYTLAKKLINKYATSFPEDYEFNNFILKSALATGDPFFAAEIAEKLSKRTGVLL